MTTEDKKELRRARYRDWYAKNKERILARRREMKEKKKLDWKKWYASHREEYLARCRELYIKNKEKITARNRKRYWDKRDERREYSKQYHQAHKDEIKLRKKIARADETKRAQYKKLLRAKRALRKNPTNTSAAMTVLESKMKFCDRMKLTALKLPCGDREECFLSPKCKFNLKTNFTPRPFAFN
jgi:exonuclease VII large subunit